RSRRRGASLGTPVMSLAADLHASEEANAPPPMSREEARRCVERITRHLDEARALLLELYERRGWRALGYDSWRACEFSQSPTAPLLIQRHLDDDDDSDSCRIVAGDAANLPLPDGAEHGAACQPAACAHVALIVTSPPYCLGIRDQGYLDFTAYPDYLAAAATWAAELHPV